MVQFPVSWCESTMAAAAGTNAPPGDAGLKVTSAQTLAAQTLADLVNVIQQFGVKL